MRRSQMNYVLTLLLCTKLAQHNHGGRLYVGLQKGLKILCWD